MKKFKYNDNNKNKMENVEGIIYKIVSKDTKKVYVGQTLSHSYDETNNTWKTKGIDTRWGKHIAESNNGKNDLPLYIDMRKYGTIRFTCSIIKEVDYTDLDQLDELEHFYMKKFDTLNPDKGYNVYEKTVNNSKTKTYILKCINKVNKEVDYNPKTRQERRCQVVVKQDEINTFFTDKEIEKVFVSSINKNKVPHFTRVAVYVKNQSDIYRCDFKNKKFEVTEQLAKQFVDSLSFPNKPKNQVNETIQHLQKKVDELEHKINLITNGQVETEKQQTEEKDEEKQIEDDTPTSKIIEVNHNNVVNKEYKYQSRIINIDPNMRSITGNSYFQKSINNYVYVIFIWHKNSKQKVQFGGRSQTVEESYEVAKDFVKRLKDHYKLDDSIGINLNEIRK